MIQNYRTPFPFLALRIGIYGFVVFFLLSCGGKSSELSLFPDPIKPSKNRPVALDADLVHHGYQRTDGVLQATDEDGDILTFNISLIPKKGLLKDFDHKTGSFTYVRNMQLTGEDSFSFYVTDGYYKSNTATITIVRDSQTGGDDDPPDDDPPDDDDPPIIDPPDIDPSRTCEGTLFVDTTGSDSNPGSENLPVKTISKGLSLAQPGDVIQVKDGIYNGTITTVRAGTASNPIVLCAENKGGAKVTNQGRVLNVEHPHITIHGFEFDAQYGTSDAIRIKSSASHFVFKHNEVHKSKRDCIDIASPSDVLISDSKIHDCLWFSPAREDAHAIVTYGVRNLTILRTECYYVTGDCLQVQDYGWMDVVVKDCQFWNGPITKTGRPWLPDSAVGITNVGENAIDTKEDWAKSGSTPGVRDSLFVYNSVFYGWTSDSISNGAALNLKENVEVVVDGNIFYGNDIALRLRHPSRIFTMNNIFYNNQRAIRYEDGIEYLKIWNNTFGSGNGMFFNDEDHGQGFEVKNNLFLSGSKPSEASHSSNMAVPASDFIDAPNHDYHPKTTSAAINGGTDLGGVNKDFEGNSRPLGNAFDIGAFEIE